VRDLILDIEKNPIDIDFTMAGEPTDIYQNIDKTNLSHFITEKFGTITLIPKKVKNQKLEMSDNNLSILNLPAGRQGSQLSIQYELTPLRTENEYSDNRHPEKINRQDDILLDSNRRDFSINCMYYFSTNFDKISFPQSRKIKRKKIKNIEYFQKSLDKN